MSDISGREAEEWAKIADQHPVHARVPSAEDLHHVRVLDRHGLSADPNHVAVFLVVPDLFRASDYDAVVPIKLDRSLQLRQPGVGENGSTDILSAA